MYKYLSSSILTVICLCLFQSAFAQPSLGSKKDSTGFNHTQMTNLGSSSLLVRCSACLINDCGGYNLRKATLNAHFYAGNPYTLGSTTHDDSVSIEIKAYTTFSGTSGLMYTLTAKLKINQNAPEQIYTKDFTTSHDSVNRFVITVTQYGCTNNTELQNNIRLSLFYNEEMDVDASVVPVVNNLVTPKNPTNFAWTDDCEDVRNYQFQLLRLYNTKDSTPYTGNEKNIKTKIEWAKALTIETQSTANNLKLPLVEGRGYYVWRVRAIGHYYDGGIANWRNWGVWSNVTDNKYLEGSTLDITNATVPSDNYIFFYDQFDDTLNWIYSRTFSEGDPLSSAFRMSEKMTYANGLQQVKQTQTHVSSVADVIASQTVYDYSGRPALSTLAAPLSTDSFSYKPGFIKVGSVLYGARYFDADTNYTDPNPATGILHNYFSNANADSTIPNAENYPFSRAMYDRDGTGRVKEQSGPGDTHRIRPSNDHTTRTFYAGVSDQELIRIFGDEAPNALSVHKVVTIDPNKTATINYISKEGQTIATSLSIGTDSTGSILDTVPGYRNSVYTIHDTLRGKTKLGNYSISTAKPLVFTVTTSLTLNYQLTKKDIEYLCTNFCSTCDYTIELLVHSDDTTYTVRKVLSPASCEGVHLFTFDTTLVLNAGKYIIEKRVHTNNLVTGSSTYTYLQQHLDSLRNSLQDMANDSLATVYDFLSRSSMDSLYEYLLPGIDLYVDNPDSVFSDSLLYVNIGCNQQVGIPILVCSPPYDCSDSTPDFEAYFIDRWAHKPEYTGTTGGYLNFFLPAFSVTPGQFNTLVSNMINDEYNCEDVWKCWDRLTQNFDNAKELANGSDGYNNDMLTEFLDCTGRKLKGYSNLSGKYIDSAYVYFKYTYGNNIPCDSYFTPPPSQQDSLHGLIYNKLWEQYYQCVRNPGPSSTNTTLEKKADVEGACLSACGARYEDFVQSTIRTYHNDSLYVGGDRYYLQRDTTWGQQYSFSVDTLPASFTNYAITREQVECMAYSLVENCNQLCTLTVYKTGNQVDSVGNSTELANMAKAMTWAYDLDVYSGSCNSGYTQVTNPTSSDTILYTLWQKNYGGSSEDRLFDIVESKRGSGGYFLAGYTQSSQNNDITGTNRGQRDYWVIRVNDEGNRQWDKLIGGDRGDSLYCVQELLDGSLLLAGGSRSTVSGEKTESSFNNSYDFWAVKLDPYGNILWDKRYGGNSDDLLRYAIETSDGNILLGGTTKSAACTSVCNKTAGLYGTSDFWLVKLKSDGTKIWDKNFGGTGINELMVVRELQDKNYLMAGYSTAGGGNRSKAFGGADYWMVKTDTAGTKIYDNSYGGEENDYLMGAIQAKDGDIVLTGYSNSSACQPSIQGCNKYSDTEGGTYDYWMIKVKDTLYTFLFTTWQRDFLFPEQEDAFLDRHMDIKETEKGEFIIGGSSDMNFLIDDTLHACNYNLEEPNYEWLILKLNSLGNEVWNTRFGGGGDDYFTAIDQDEEGYYWLAGYSYSNADTTGNCNKTAGNYGMADFWVIRARDYCEHPPICFKWTQSIKFAADSNTVVFEPITCDSSSAGAVLSSIYQQVGAIIDQQVADFSSLYTNTCADPDSLNDIFSLQYKLGTYHYTLYYYDRAGNLVRTVSPTGVDNSKTNRLQHPSHAFVTKYSYNSLKQLVKQETPDGGETEFWYDYKGQLRFSRNAKQKPDSLYSYTKYDNLGRIIEVGQSSKNSGGNQFLDSLNNPKFPSDNNSERTYTVYTKPAPGFFFSVFQRNLQNRVSYTYTDDYATTYFSYDPHGNVELVIQVIPEFGFSFIRYEYDLISNKVIGVHSNEGLKEEYHQRFSYDSDQRIKSAWTSWIPVSTVLTYPKTKGIAGNMTRARVGWDRDANYKYYKHGPLSRTEIGEDNIQGVDNVYTVQGWLKGINYPSLAQADDPGSDGLVALGFAPDAFGMVLGYYSADFNRTNSKYNPSSSKLISSQTGIRNLFNGNISNWTLQTDTVTAITPAKLMGLKYSYDQLNRLMKEDYNEYGTSWSDPASYFDNQFTYDGNGRIDSLLRYADGGLMDSMKFNYYSGKNRLEYVDDGIADGTYTGDADDQSAGNYKYTAIGERAKDIENSIDTITWTVYGKVKTIKKTNGDSIWYLYDAAGNRVLKGVYSNNITTKTFYIKDASGNDISIYEKTVPSADTNIIQTEVPIYGSDLLGYHKTNLLRAAADTSPYYTRIINAKEYILSDHLNSSRVVVSDQKNSNKSAQILSYNNYYAYGMPLMGANKNYNANSLRKGYGNYEKDDEVYGFNGSLLDMGARFVDGLIPVTWSPDKLEGNFAYQSPYTYAENRPIDGIDLDGKEWVSVKTYDPFTGIFTIENTVKIKVVDNSEVITGININSYLDDYKKEAEKSFTQFDKNNNIQYKLKIEFEIIKEGEEKGPFTLEFIDEDLTVEGGGLDFRGKVEQIGNTQANKILINVGFKTVLTTHEQFDIADRPKVFAGELGHTGGLFHPDSQSPKHLPSILEKHQAGSIPNNLMYHEEGGTLESEQLKKVSKRTSEQQGTPQNAKDIRDE